MGRRSSATGRLAIFRFGGQEDDPWPMCPDDPESVQVPITWVGAEDLPVLFANQFVAQVDRGEVFLTVGQLVPPAILGRTDEERRAQAESVQFVPVKPIVRIAMTPSRLRELASVLEVTLRNLAIQEEEFGDPRNA